MPRADDWYTVEDRDGDRYIIRLRGNKRDEFKIDPVHVLGNEKHLFGPDVAPALTREKSGVPYVLKGMALKS
jgi:hypothetical protein